MMLTAACQEFSVVGCDKTEDRTKVTFEPSLKEVVAGHNVAEQRSVRELFLNQCRRSRVFIQKFIATVAVYLILCVPCSCDGIPKNVPYSLGPSFCCSLQWRSWCCISAGADWP